MLLVSIGARSTHLLMIEPGALSARTIMLGGNHVTQAVADELKLGLAPAEALKLAVFTGDDQIAEDGPERLAVLNALQSFAGRLGLEITRSITGHQRRYGSGGPEIIYLAGGGARFPGLQALLAGRFKCRFETFEALSRVEHSLAAAAQEEVFADLVGLASGLVVKAGAVPDLLPPALRRERDFRRRRPWFVAAAALVAVILLPPLAHYRAAVGARQEQSTTLDRQLGTARKLAARHKEDLARLAATRKQLEVWRNLVAAKTGWVELLSDLQERLVKTEDVWLDQLQIVLPAPGESAPAAAPLRLNLTGRLLDASHPDWKVSADSCSRVQLLRASLAESPFVTAVENERFDNSEPGLLRFDFTLVVNPRKAL